MMGRMTRRYVVLDMEDGTFIWKDPDSGNWEWMDTPSIISEAAVYRLFNGAYLDEDVRDDIFVIPIDGKIPARGGEIKFDFRLGVVLPEFMEGDI